MCYFFVTEQEGKEESERGGDFEEGSADNRGADWKVRNYE